MAFDKLVDRVYCTVCLATNKQLVCLQSKTDGAKLEYCCKECDSTFSDGQWLRRDELLDIVISFVLAPLDEEILKQVIKEKLESKQSK